MKNTPPQKTTKHDLLVELESIRASLHDTNSSEYEDIPILEDLVIDDESCPDNIAQTLEKLSRGDYTHITTDLIEPAEPTEPVKTHAAKPENPFLPPHIRERLKQNRQDAALFYQSLMLNNATDSIKTFTSQQIITHEYIAKAISGFISNMSNTAINTFPINVEDSTAANIDRLATLYLPIFEAQLRQQLAQTISITKKSAQNAKTP